jgi:type 1 fimbria pilin
MVAGTFLVVVGLNAQAADVRVKGSIAPASCSFSIPNAVIDYGKIDRTSLSPTQYTMLETKTTPFTIKCEARTQAAISAVDNRASSKVTGILSGYTEVHNFGLGVTSSGDKIGGYRLGMRNSVADGKAVGVLRSNTAGATWQRIAETIGQAPTLTSWASPGTLTPVAFTSLSGNVFVIAHLNKTADLSLKNEVALDGHATLELKYL